LTVSEWRSGSELQAIGRPGMECLMVQAFGRTSDPTQQDVPWITTEQFVRITSPTKSRAFL